MSNRTSAVQAAIRAVTSTAWTYTGDWHAYADHHSIATGELGERILALAKVIDATIPTANVALELFLQDPTHITV